MPVRSLNSPVLKWPDDSTVHQAVIDWVEARLLPDENVLRVGYYGSYSRGDWGVGSDLDLVIILQHCPLPIRDRPAIWDVSTLPVPAELVVFTQEEWQEHQRQKRLFSHVLQDETRWVFSRR